MSLTWDDVYEMRRLYAEHGVGSRQIDEMFGYTGSQGILRGRLWADPEYAVPEPLKPGPKAALIEIDGVEKSVDQWAEDPNCEVAARTIRSRYAQGVRGRDLLVRKSAAGRPRGGGDRGALPD